MSVKTTPPKKYTDLKKILALTLIIVLIANVLLFAFRVYSATIFWCVIIISAIIAFPGMNYLNKHPK